MAKPRLCMTCGEHEKKRGNARNCFECWLVAQPMDVQIRYAAARAALIPEELRLARVAPEHWPPERRWCAGCQTFVRQRDCAGKAARCRPCVAAVGRAYRLERDYSITQAEYDAVFKFQGGRCYLCGRKSVRVPLAADHDHRTGELRGLLCPDKDWGCNLKIVARFDADPDPIAMVLRLLQYYRDPPARKVLKR